MCLEFLKLYERQPSIENSKDLKQKHEIVEQSVSKNIKRTTFPVQNAKS